MGAGRPRINLEPEQVRKLAAIHCTVDEIADVMNYITNSWDNNLNIQITEKRVNELKK